MRLRVTAVALLALILAGCSHETELKESRAKVAHEQAEADAHNASTIPSPGDDDTPSTDEPATGTAGMPEYEGADPLRVGDCIDLPTNHTATVRSISCQRLHHGEVTARVNISASFPNGAPTPQDYRHLTDTVCQQAFDAYVRQPPPENVRPDSLDPTPELWFSGVRDVICTAAPEAEGNILTGSVRKAR